MLTLAGPLGPSDVSTVRSHLQQCVERHEGLFESTKFLITQIICKRADVVAEVAGGSIVIKDRVIGEWITLQIFLESVKNSRMPPGQIGQANRGPERTVHQLQVEVGAEHILDIGFVASDVVCIGEHFALVEELPLVKILNALLILLLEIDEHRDVQMLLCANQSNEGWDFVRAANRGNCPISAQANLTPFLKQGRI